MTEEPRELKYELVVKTSRYAGTKQYLLLAHLVDGNGTRVDPARVSVSASARGVKIPELRFHGGWRGHYAFLRVAKGVSVTVRAKLDGREVATVSHRV